MDALARLWQHEPALVIGFAEAIFALVVGLGLELDPEAMAAMIAFLAPLGAFLTRLRVYSTASGKALEERLENEAGAHHPLPTGVELPHGAILDEEGEAYLAGEL